MKKYLYNNEIYCDEDLSEEIDNYGGDLDFLIYQLEKHKIVEQFESVTTYIYGDYLGSDIENEEILENVDEVKELEEK